MLKIKKGEVWINKKNPRARICIDSSGGPGGKNIIAFKVRSDDEIGDPIKIDVGVLLQTYEKTNYGFK